MDQFYYWLFSDGKDGLILWVKSNWIEFFSHLFIVYSGIFGGAMLAADRIMYAAKLADKRANVTSERANQVIIWGKKLENYQKIASAMHDKISINDYHESRINYTDKAFSNPIEISIREKMNDKSIFSRAVLKQALGFGSWLMTEETIKIVKEFLRLLDEGLIEDFEKEAENDLKKYIDFKHNG